MKKQILSFAIVAAIIGSIAAGCGSEKSATSSADSAKRADSAKMSTPAKPDSTIKQDTAKHDTTKTPPKM
ncbi:MAG: hypothetical protein V4592_15550 [Bacteroidota bacterium]